MNDNVSRKEYLQNKKSYYEEQLHHCRRNKWIVPIITTLMAIGMPLLIYQLMGPNDFTFYLSFIYVILPIYSLSFFSGREEIIEKELKIIELDIDIEEFEINKEVSYAEKTLRLHNNQLQRYYDLNLKENRWVFILGILCIIVGFAIVSGTSYILITTVNLNETSQIIIGCLGALGSILSNFVGALYIKMNTTVTDSLKEFHARLVDTHKLLMGNLIATKIENKDIKDTTYSEMAKKISEK